MDIKEFINKVDYHGFTPLLLIVKTFSESKLNNNFKTYFTYILKYFQMQTNTKTEDLKKSNLKCS